MRVYQHENVVYKEVRALPTRDPHFVFPSVAAFVVIPHETSTKKHGQEASQYVCYQEA